MPKMLIIDDDIQLQKLVLIYAELDIEKYRIEQINTSLVSSHRDRNGQLGELLYNELE
jgi:hypothetical protein